MKKTALATITVLALALGTAACSSGTASSAGSASAPAASASTAAASTSSAPAAAASSSAPAASSASSVALTSSGSTLTATDRNANLEGKSGVAITIKPGPKGTATFQLIDPATGKNYADYYVFDYGTNTFLRHHDSTAMGKIYNYTIDLSTKKLVSVKDGTGKDLTASIKKRGMWNGAEQDNVGFMTAAEAYFQTHFGKSIKDAATQG